MIKLNLANVVKGKNHIINADSDLAEGNLRNVTHIDFVRRYEGLGRGFKGRAPNRAVIHFGDRRWSCVVLPDDYNFDSLKTVTLFDSTKQLEPLEFAQSKNPSLWEAQQRVVSTATTQQGGGGAVHVQAGQSGGTRVFEVEKAIKKQFDFVGGVGVNDLGFALAITVQVHYDDKNEKVEQALYDFGDKIAEQYGVQVGMNIQVVGSPGGKHRLVGEGNIGESQYPEHAMAGRQQIAPVGAGTADPTDQATAVRPFTEGWNGPNETPLEVGQSEEPYGSLGPQDPQGT